MCLLFLWRVWGEDKGWESGISESLHLSWEEALIAEIWDSSPFLPLCFSENQLARVTSLLRKLSGLLTSSRPESKLIGTYKILYASAFLPLTYSALHIPLQSYHVSHRVPRRAPAFLQWLYLKCSILQFSLPLSLFLIIPLIPASNVHPL